MNNLDSLTLKYFFEENESFIKGAIVQKIQLPSRYEIVFLLRNLNLKKNKKLYININPKYPHICFADENSLKKRNVKSLLKPPAFCMQLRKYLAGSKIKDFKLIEYERILEFYFDYFDEIGSLTSLCLAVELMGKHSNIILYNSSSRIILGSIHNISQDKSSIREVFGGAKYIYPPLKNKSDILKTSYAEFDKYFKISKDNLIDNFYYFTKPLLSFILSKTQASDEVFETMQKLQAGNLKSDIISFWNGVDSVNSAIDTYFSNFVFEDVLKNEKNKLKKYLQKDLKKFQKAVLFPADTAKENRYKHFGDLIMANLYSVENIKNEVEIDTTISLQQNAQKYYALYKKEKISNEHKTQRYNQAKDKLDYYENILFSIENAEQFDELSEIKNEMIELNLIHEQKEKIETKPNTLEYKGYSIYYGKNNKQNDFLISKIAKDNDLWFHGGGFASSHVILKIPKGKKEPDADVLEYCARLVKKNSKAKLSGKVSIIYTRRKNLKKPPDTYLGYVTYKNEKEIVIN